MINPKIIRFDELQYYTKKVWRHVKNVYVEYVYDANEATNLCELQPSYYLIPYNTDVVFKKRTDEATKQMVYDILDDCINEPMYHHVNKCNGYFIDIDTDRYETMEDVVEYLMCNPPYFESIIEQSKLQ